MSEKQEKESNEPEENKTKEEGKASATIDDVKRIVNEAMESVKSILVGNNKIDDDDGETDPNEKAKEHSKERRATMRSSRDIEEQSKSLVESAVRTVLGEFEHKKEHEDMKKKPAVTEKKAPANRRWIQKAILGGKYLEEQDK